MFGVIDAGLIMDLARRGGFMSQLSFDFPPMIEVPLDTFCDISVKWSWDDSGHMGVYETVEHPTMNKIRKMLESRGYIECMPWCNGDTVLKTFYLNRMLFDVGDRFVSAPALNYTMKKWIDSDEYKRRDPMYYGDE